MLNVRPKCKCGNMCKPNGISKVDGRNLYVKLCRSCSKAKHGTKDIRLKGYKKESCEACFFVPIHPCQLDVDHIDGDRNNMDLSNLQTLCANCHRIKTLREKNWLPS